jgi:hypothetical protein
MYISKRIYIEAIAEFKYCKTVPFRNPEAWERKVMGPKLLSRNENAQR